MQWKYNGAYNSTPNSIQVQVDVPVSVNGATYNVENGYIYIKLPFLRVGDVSGVARDDYHIYMEELDMGHIKDGSLQLQCRVCHNSLVKECKIMLVCTVQCIHVLILTIIQML